MIHQAHIVDSKDVECFERKLTQTPPQGQGTPTTGPPNQHEETSEPTRDSSRPQHSPSRRRDAKTRRNERWVLRYIPGGAWAAKLCRYVDATNYNEVDATERGKFINATEEEQLRSRVPSTRKGQEGRHDAADVDDYDYGGDDKKTGSGSTLLRMRGNKVDVQDTTLKSNSKLKLKGKGESGGASDSDEGRRRHRRGKGLSPQQKNSNFDLQQKMGINTLSPNNASHYDTN
jgi:hypothetical protein